LVDLSFLSVTYKKNKKNVQVWPKPHMCHSMIPPKGKNEPYTYNGGSNHAKL